MIILEDCVAADNGRDGFSIGVLPPGTDLRISRSKALRNGRTGFRFEGIELIRKAIPELATVPDQVIGEAIQVVKGKNETEAVANLERSRFVEYLLAPKWSDKLNTIFSFIRLCRELYGA